jgi:hypothetical protein
MRNPEANTTSSLAGGAACLGMAGSMACYFAGSEGPRRFFANWIMWWMFLLSIVLGALFLVAVEHVVGAHWSVPLRRTAERISMLLVPLFPVGVVALLGVSTLYSWAGPEAFADPLLQEKAAYLNLPFFALRAAACFLLWYVFYRLLVVASVRQDFGLAPDFAGRAKCRAVLFMLVFGVTLSVAAIDWLMSLEPNWFSTIIAVYLFAEAMLGGLAAVTLLSLYLKRVGRLPGIKADHLYNLGALIFGFSSFWAYIAYSQMMLMWYGNLPQENIFYLERISGSWLAVSVLLPVVHFLIPVFALMSRPAKSNEKRLCWVSVLLLVSVLLSTYWFVFPVLGWGVVCSWPEASFLLFFAGSAVLFVHKSLSFGPDMPENDPHLQDGLEFAL